MTRHLWKNIREPQKKPANDLRLLSSRDQEWVVESQDISFQLLEQLNRDFLVTLDI